MSTNGITLMIDSARGIYIPQTFAEHYEGWQAGYASFGADLAVLKAGPDTPDYWECWDNVLGNAYYTDVKGHKWTIWQDGDLFAICDELLSDDGYKEFFGVPRY